MKFVSFKSAFQTVSMGFLLFVMTTGNQSFAEVITSDSAIDAIVSQYKIVAGGIGGGVNRGADVIDCNSPPTSHPLETNCPNDATYSPSQYTGGYQAWGVGMGHYGMTYDWKFDCGWRYRFVWSDGYWNLDVYYECVLVPEQTPGFTAGQAVSRIEWGDGIIVPSSIGSGPLSTLAFRPNNLTPCLPVVLLDFPDVGCGNATNSSYVSDAGYEAKIVIDDPSCDTLTGYRDGVTDQFFGCFTAITVSWISNFPTPYLDTNFADSEDTFTASIGEINAIELETEKIYANVIGFSSTGNPQMLGQTKTYARHTGSITSDLDLHPGCIAALDAPPFCFFGVDTASVGGAANYFYSLP